MSTFVSRCLPPFPEAFVTAIENRERAENEKFPKNQKIAKANVASELLAEAVEAEAKAVEAEAKAVTAKAIAVEAEANALEKRQLYDVLLLAGNLSATTIDNKDQEQEEIRIGRFTDIVNTMLMEDETMVEWRGIKKPALGERVKKILNRNDYVARRRLSAREGGLRHTASLIDSPERQAHRNETLAPLTQEKLEERRQQLKDLGRLARPDEKEKEK